MTNKTAAAVFTNSNLIYSQHVMENTGIRVKTLFLCTSAEGLMDIIAPCCPKIYIYTI